MSDLTITFNENGKAKLEAAAKAFGFNSNETAANFALDLLKVVTDAKRTGNDIAIIQDIRAGNTFSVIVDKILDLKNTAPQPDGTGYSMPILTPRNDPKF